MQGKCERGRGSANADGAGAEAFAGDGYSQGASFGPMAAISRRGQGGRIYNNTRARVLLRRMCVKSAALTTHSPPKTFARPRTAHALAEHFRSPTQPRRTPAGCAMHSPPKTSARPRRSSSPTPHSDTPFPSTSAPPRNADARPQAARCTPRRPHNTFPTEDLRSPPHSDTPLPSTSARPAAPTHARRLRDARPPPSRPIPRCATLPPLLFRFGHKKTAPHSACAMPNVSVDRRCGRSFGLVSRALFAAVAGRWRVGVGLRPQPWALRSRRCGRVLRA